MTPAEEEAYVRSQWYEIRIESTPQYGVTGMPVYWTIQMGENLQTGYDTFNESIHAAYLFTKHREAEIASVEEEIIILRSMIALLVTERGDMTTPVYQRILDREQAALAELKKGWK